MIPLVRERGQGFDAQLWDETGALRILDQRRLPNEIVELRCETLDQVAEAIRSLAVRGAPAIGVAAAYGVALVARQLAARGLAARTAQAELDAAVATLAATRPTAVNLFWALDRMQARAAALRQAQAADWAAALLQEAYAVHAEDQAMCEAMGQHGLALVPEGARILTHCNAGALATGGYGTALGVVRAAHAQGRVLRVYADETRPLLQGARLTAWELLQDGIPVTLLADSMAAFAMARQGIDLVVVGADRIVANGDVANKIGTYGVALAARAHGVPFYVAAPSSTFDLGLPEGGAIPIEERAPDELRRFAGQPSAPAQVEVWNPAFDVTPAHLVSAIITERGVARPPYAESLPRLLGTASPR